MLASTRLRARLRDPIFWADAIQLLKTVLASVVAWLVAVKVFHLPQSFLAPWAALLVVHATVYRTFSQGARQVGATVVGVVLAWAVGTALGLSPLTVGLALAVALAVGAVPWFEGESTTAAATALIVLTTGFSDQDSMLLSRLFDTAIGVVVGLLVNLAVWPPLRRRTAIQAVDRIDGRIGELLVDMGVGVREGCSEDVAEEWVDRTRGLDHELDSAWGLVRQARESAWMNPRRSAREVRDPQRWFALLRRMEQAVAEGRSLAGTLGQSAADVRDWHPEFRTAYAAALEEAGEAVCAASHPGVLEARRSLDAVVDTWSEREIGRGLWPEYGGVLVNLRNVLVAMADVAEANPLGRPPLPFQRRPGGTGGPDVTSGTARAADLH